ncbi:Methyltransferase type 11 [Hydrogenobacter thermophilus TK-6]|uniref:Ribosomal protein L11 methyltransferase n=1 Tax=Hydrogenobacter thermophilus (strain DSM 6534 / IAM 12695 / TK-6) TaxID=608538 RepID=D3DFJ0_HYDTT|nr:50S ribosomal protein L11 methyltransferase [Hydrogenobacter thermophilus]ADO44536.1 Methyltransferase type 11 [Hydrogenobacter thermophilus TK-6]BAI68592.1 ribosomal protein L11 methyltransferase [Hydrogenobacter thermophilus TK-6]
MIYTRYIYSLEEEEFYQFLADQPQGVEVIRRQDNRVEFATYTELKWLKPLKVEKIKVKPPESFLRPIRIRSFLIVPPNMKTLIINPGMAFGTGLHPSTQLSLMLIEEFFKRGWSAIDVGCGSGILAFALKKLSARKVLAIDIDERAIEECEKNASLNRLKITCLKAKPEDIKESFDFLVANLELSIFKREIDHIKPLFKKLAIFSGIYGKEELEEFLFFLADLRVVKIKKLKGWYAVVVKR